MVRQKSRSERDDRSDPWGFFPKDRALKQRCYECGEMTTGRHHIVPPQLGGTKSIPLCTKCHEIVHGSVGLFHPERIRRALA